MKSSGIGWTFLITNTTHMGTGNSWVSLVNQQEREDFTKGNNSLMLGFKAHSVLNASHVWARGGNKHLVVGVIPLWFQPDRSSLKVFFPPTSSLSMCNHLYWEMILDPPLVPTQRLKGAIIISLLCNAQIAGCAVAACQTFTSACSPTNAKKEMNGFFPIFDLRLHFSWSRGSQSSHLKTGKIGVSHAVPPVTLFGANGFPGFSKNGWTRGRVPSVQILDSPSLNAG